MYIHNSPSVPVVFPLLYSPLAVCGCNVAVAISVTVSCIAAISVKSGVLARSNCFIKKGNGTIEKTTREPAGLYIFKDL